MLSRVFVVLSALVVVISGCAYAPGNNLDSSRLQDEDYDYSSDNPLLVVTPINAATILKASFDQKGTETTIPAQLTSTDGYEYRIGPQDILGITVYDHPELSGGSGNALTAAMSAPQGSTGTSTPFSTAAGGATQGDPLGQRVDSDGSIYFPFVGRVMAAGKTVSQIRSLLTRSLATYLNNPQVDVRVLAYRSQQVRVTGEVKVPGIVALDDSPLTLADAIARAGGGTDASDFHNVRVTRGAVSYDIDAFALLNKGDLSQNILLKKGDIVNVPDQSDSRVFVLGEVLKPSTLYLSRTPLTLADSLTGAAGFDNTAADPKRVYVIRGAKDNPLEPKVFRLDMTQPDALLLATQFQMRPLDVVYVATAKGVRFNRVLNLITPTLQTIFYTRQLSR